MGRLAVSCLRARAQQRLVVPASVVAIRITQISTKDFRKTTLSRPIEHEQESWRASLRASWPVLLVLPFDIFPLHFIRYRKGRAAGRSPCCHNQHLGSITTALAGYVTNLQSKLIASTTSFRSKGKAASHSQRRRKQSGKSVAARRRFQIKPIHMGFAVEEDEDKETALAKSDRSKPPPSEFPPSTVSFEMAARKMPVAVKTPDRRGLSGSNAASAFCSPMNESSSADLSLGSTENSSSIKCSKATSLLAKTAAEKIVRRIKWTAEEDCQLQKMVQQHGGRHWKAIAQGMPNRVLHSADNAGRA